MTDKLFYILIGGLILLLGLIILVLRLRTATRSDENAFSKSASYQFTILAVGLIVCGLIMIVVNI